MASSFQLTTACVGLLLFCLFASDTVEALPISPDGRCGQLFDCEPGFCCSQFGWCGNTVQHCGASPPTPPVEALPISPDGRCGPLIDCEPGLCCSPYGWCGNTIEHCGSFPPIPPTPAGDFLGLNECGPGRYIALTFDDGPWNSENTTQAVLSYLRNRGIKATFFSTISSLDFNPTLQCDLVRAIINDGHTIHGHSMNHAAASTFSNEQLIADTIQVRQRLLECGATNPWFYRPPYGDLSVEQAVALASISPNPAIVAKWNLDSNDWRETSNSQLTRDTISYFRENIGIGNSVVMLWHDLEYPSRISALNRMVNYFLNRDYTFITIDDCYARCNRRQCVSPTIPFFY